MLGLKLDLPAEALPREMLMPPREMLMPPVIEPLELPPTRDEMLPRESPRPGRCPRAVVSIMAHTSVSSIANARLGFFVRRIRTPDRKSRGQLAAGSCRPDNEHFTQTAYREETRRAFCLH